jgi:hypothetical protein
VAETYGMGVHWVDGMTRPTLVTSLADFARLIETVTVGGNRGALSCA